MFAKLVQYFWRNKSSLKFISSMKTERKKSASFLMQNSKAGWQNSGENKTRGLLNKICRANMDEKEVEACVFTSIHNTAYFSNYVYCSMGRPYGLVVGQAGKGTTISSLVDGGHALRRYKTLV